jgi:hypothetical protein
MFLGQQAVSAVMSVAIFFKGINFLHWAVKNSEIIMLEQYSIGETNCLEIEWKWPERLGGTME